MGPGHDDSTPPRWVDWLLKKFGRSSTLEEVLGDLHELYEHWVQKHGPRAARRQYVLTVLRLLKPGSKIQSPKILSAGFSTGLGASYIKITIRNFFKNIGYSLINLSGLSLGLAVSILIFLFVTHELSFDKFLPGHERVVRIQPRVTQGTGERTWATSEGFLAPAIQAAYPEVESTTRLVRFDEWTAFTYDSRQFHETGVIGADSTFFDVFPFPFTYGDPSTALDKPGGMVISGDVARRLFGDIDPIGKVVVSGEYTVVITGVFENIPDNSHQNFNIVFPLKWIWSDADQSRNLYAFYSYLKLKTPEEIEPLSKKLLSDWQKLYGYIDSNGNPNPPDRFNTKLELMPVSSIHLESSAEKEWGVNGSLQIVYVFLGVACLALIVVVINYVNLSNAISLKRGREIAIRKTIGASRGKLLLAFAAESHAFSLVAIVIAFLLAVMLLPRFNLLTGKQFDWHSIFNVNLLVPTSALWVVIGTLSCIYPASVLSSFNPVQIMKSGVSVVKGGMTSLYFRRGLLAFQFAIDSLLIIVVYTIWSQMDFINTMHPGFNRSNVLILTMTGDAFDKTQVIKDAVAGLEDVEDASFTSAVPGKRVVFLTVRVPDLAGSRDGSDTGTRDMRVLAVDEDFVKTMQLEVIEGRDFSIANGADRESAFLLNEAAAKEFGLKDPVGKPFEYVFRQEKKGQVIGIVKDFNYASIHGRVEPLMIHLQSWNSFLCIRLNTDSTPESVQAIERVWKSISTSPFIYSFLDETYDAQYRSERITAELVTYLASLALLFAALGLFGVVSFFIAQRAREVGIRKVFGASQLSLLRGLSGEYMLVVVAGNIFALYPALWLVRQWLDKFAVRIEMSSLPFLFALLVSVVLAGLSIFRVVIQTTRTNPANVLRSE